jgi:hypothetical protein
MLARRAQSLSDRVRAALKPVMCEPPSTVLMLLAKVKMFSV